MLLFESQSSFHDSSNCDATKQLEHLQILTLQTTSLAFKY